MRSFGKNLKNGQATAMRARRARRAFAVAVGLTVAAAATPAVASAEAFRFVPEGTYVRALDAAGNDVTQAGARPDRLAVRFEFPTVINGTARDPVELVKDVEVTLPDGLQGNPLAAPTCPAAVFARKTSDCSPETQVGEVRMIYRGARNVLDETYALYNVESSDGLVARFGVNLHGFATQMDMSVKSDGTYAIVTNVRGIGQPIHQIALETVIWGVPALKKGLSTGIPLLTMGSQCGITKPATIRATAWRQPDRWIEANPLMLALTGCDRLSFRPSMDVRPLSSAPDAPSGYRVKLSVPQNQNPTATATPPLKRAEILFPEGTAISPGGANGLGSCSDEQAKIGVDATPHCPADARIGSVRIDTPVLDVPLEGGLFVATPKSNDSQSGDMFRVFLVASAKGVDIKQEGKLYPDPVTGRLKAVFDNAAQQPFETLTVDMDGGPGAALVNPATCGRHTTTATLTSWGGQTVTSDSSFTIDCVPGLGGFSPSLLAGTASPIAGANSPFNLSIQKPDGQRALSGVRLALPKGLLANLKGNLGQVVGSVRAFAGTGAAPFVMPGTVTLEGAYGDAPFSLKVVVPAKAGPYDLGEVVVRQKLYVDPETAQVTVASDPIPTILQGVPTRIQRLDVHVDKPGFMINPTTCEPQAIGGSLSSDAGQSQAVDVRFQASACGDLPYAPKLGLKIGGPAKDLRNGGHPQLDATLVPRRGDANHRKAQVTLPLNLALDPQNAKALCEPAAAARNECPAESIVGTAKAISILDVPLEGPVYFVRGERTTSTGRVVATLPKLFIPLKGQGVTVNVRASSDVVSRKLQTTFDNLPDAPIERFDLTIDGGANGILKVTNGDVCKSTSTPKVGQRLVGQNGRVFRADSVLATGCKTAIVRTKPSGSHVAVTVGGLPGSRAKVTVSGKGLSRESRTIGASSTVATLKPRLSAASRRALRAGRKVRIKVTTTVKPTVKGNKATKVTETVVVKPAKKPSK